MKSGRPNVARLHKAERRSSSLSKPPHRPWEATMTDNPGTGFIPEIREISRPRLTKLLQTLYARGTPRRPRACLMKRCQRILHPIVPNMKTIVTAVCVFLGLSANIWAAGDPHENKSPALSPSDGE